MGDGDLSLLLFLLNSGCLTNVWAWNCTVSWEGPEVVSQLDFLVDLSGNSPITVLLLLFPPLFSYSFEFCSPVNFRGRLLSRV